MDQTRHKISIDDIHVGERFRKDNGTDPALAKLIASLDRVGLLHPIVLTKDYELISGYRRIQAAKCLDWETIDYVVATDAKSAAELLIAERDENTCREPFTPLEAVEIGKAIEAIEKPKARQRQKATMARGRDASGKPVIGGGTQPPRHENQGGALGGANLAQPTEKQRTRDAAAQAAGMSPETYRKAKTVSEAAEAEPETFGPIAEEMDRTGKVDPAFKKVREIQELRKPEAEKRPPKPKPWDHTREMENLVDTIKPLIKRWVENDKGDACATLINQLLQECGL